MLISPTWLLCKHGGLYVLLLLLVVNSFGRTSYLKIYATDLRHIFTVGRGSQFLWFIHGTDSLDACG